MNKKFSNLLSILLVLVILCGFMPVRVSANTSALAAQINAISGLHADADAGTITVTGTNDSITAPLSLALDADVTVNWEATYSGAVSPASASMITINGSGTFNVRNSGFISNAGTGNTLNIAGSDTTVRVNNGGTVQSGRSGSAVLITNDNIVLDVGIAGYVMSLDGNANAAVQIGGSSTTLGTAINVNGGSVISIGSGFAINDGAGTTLLDNNTVITVTGGVISAGGNSAIHSTGNRSAVVVSGGIISNAAGNNLNPAVDMLGDMAGAAPPAYNITVGGTSVVQSTSANGYALQSKGNILIQGDALVTAINGRAVNLVGPDSTALIRGGTVETTGNGTAISTATTNVETVPRASIEVTGGKVLSANGYAVNTTGVNSAVTVRGGSVSTASASNHAINASGANATIALSGSAIVSAVGGDAIRTAATNSEAVSVSGNAKVSSITGRAIQANGAGAAVTARGSCQIWVQNAGNAIRCTGGTVTLYSGFVFAYGTDALHVLNAENIVTVTTPSSVAIVVAWDINAGNREYLLGYSSVAKNPDLDVEVYGGNQHFWWYNHPTLGGGINYIYGSNVGFFPLTDVTVIREHGLIFDSSTGYMYENINGSGIPGGVNVRTTYGNVGFTPQWTGSPGELRLYGFSWNTNALVALTIVGNTRIVMNNDSRFESTHASGIGIQFGNTEPGAGSEEITLTGSKTLTAAGSDLMGTGVNIRTGKLIIDSGIFVAQAGRAINWTPPDTERVVADPDIFDYIWKYSFNFDGDNAVIGYGNDESFILNATHRYVMFRAVTPVNLIAAQQIGGTSRIADSVAVVLTFDKPVSGLTTDDITIINGSGSAVKGVLNGSGTSWILTLGCVDAEGFIDIEVSEHFDAYYVSSNKQTDVEIYKAEINRFDMILTNTVQNGGDFEQLFEFEVFFASDPREPQTVPLTTDPDDPDAYYVTYANSLPLPPGRIVGDNNNILLLKHGEAIIIHGLPVGFYFICEHMNQGFITAFDIDSEGWFTAPDGTSRIFRLASDIEVDTFNSIVTEEPGEPERPFDPDDPEKIIEPDVFNLLLSKTVQPEGDFTQLFEFEVLSAGNSGVLQAVTLSTDPLDIDTLYVTYSDGLQLPPGRVTGDDHSVVLLLHNETIRVRNLQTGSFVIMEHANEGYITAFNINSGGWFTAPDGLSRQFNHDSITTADCFNSIIPETPGEPSRPFDPENPQPAPVSPVKSPQTGTYSDLTLPLVMMIIGIFALTGAEVYRRKSGRGKPE